MNLERQHYGNGVIIISFVVSFMLAIMPLPAWATLWRPEWTIMVLIYWCIAVPQRVGVATGWFVGLIHDVLDNSLLGLHALTVCLIAYLSVRLHRRVRLFPVWQQAMGVFVLVALDQFLGTLIRAIFLGNPPTGWSFFYPAVTSMLLWPWVFIVLRDMRRNYQIF